MYFLPLALAGPVHLTFDWRPGDVALIRAALSPDAGPVVEEEWQLLVLPSEPGKLEVRVLDVDGTARFPPEWTPGGLTFKETGRLQAPVPDTERASAALWFAWVERWVGTDRAAGEERVDRLILAAPALGWREVPTSIRESVDNFHPCGRRAKPVCAEVALMVFPDEAEVTRSFEALRAAHPEVGAATVSSASVVETWSVGTEVDTLRPDGIIGTRTVQVSTSDGGSATRETTVRYTFTWERRR